MAKWAQPGKEYGVDDYILGIETVRAWVGTNCGLVTKVNSL